MRTGMRAALAVRTWRTAMTVGTALVLGVLGVLALAVLAARYAGWDASIFSPAVPAPPAARIPVVSLDQLLDSPEAYVGQFVTVTGEFDGAVGRQSFQIEDDDVFFDDDVLVVTNLALDAIPGWPDATGGVDGPGSVPITVRGTVRELNVGALERELGVDLDDERLEGRAGRVVIVARSVGITPGEPVIRPR